MSKDKALPMKKGDLHRLWASNHVEHDSGIRKKNPTKDTTQRLAFSSDTNNIIGFTPIKTLPKPQEITEEQLRAVTRDGKDLIYVALAHVALSRGKWVLKEEA